MDKSIKSKLHRQTLERFKRLRVTWTAFAAHRLKPMGVVPNQALVLRFVHRMGPSSLAEIAAATLLDPAAVVRVADSLVGQGWIERQEHPTDRRRWLVCLSPTGKKVAAKLMAFHLEILAELLSPLTDGELRLFNDLLEKLWAPHDPAQPGKPKNQPKRKKP